MPHNKNFAEVGRRIAELRGARTQAEFAAKLGVDRKTVVRWEAGERIPDGGSLLAMVCEFDADINYILTGQGNAPAPSQLSRRAQALLDNYDHASPEGKATMEQMGILLAQQECGAKKHACGKG